MRFLFCLLFLWLVLIDAIALSAPPLPVLRVVVNDEPFELPDHDAPIKFIAGDTVTFDLGASEGADRFFVMLDNHQAGERELSTKNKWKLTNLRTRSGEYQLRFIVSNEESTVELRRTVQVLCKEPTLPDDPVPPTPTPPKPTPTPTPPPGPPPVPPQPPAPLPPGEFGVAEKVAAIVRKIDSPSRAAQATQLADAADALASEINAGAVKNAQDVMSRIGDGIKSLNSPVWVATAPTFTALMKETWFANSVRLKVTEKFDMVQPVAWSILLREIATGLRSVK